MANNHRMLIKWAEKWVKTVNSISKGSPICTEADSPQMGLINRILGCSWSTPVSSQSSTVAEFWWVADYSWKERQGSVLMCKIVSWGNPRQWRRQNQGQMEKFSFSHLRLWPAITQPNSQVEKRDMGGGWELLPAWQLTDLGPYTLSCFNTITIVPVGSQQHQHSISAPTVANRKLYFIQDDGYKAWSTEGR